MHHTGVLKEIKTAEGGPETEISFDVKKLTHHLRWPRSNGESIAIWLSFYLLSLAIVFMISLWV